MFQNKRIKRLESKVKTLTKELQKNGTIGTTGPYFFMYAPNNNAVLGEEIGILFRKLGAERKVLRALLKYLKLEYLECGVIRKIKKNK